MMLLDLNAETQKRRDSIFKEKSRERKATLLSLWALLSLKLKNFASLRLCV